MLGVASDRIGFVRPGGGSVGDGSCRTQAVVMADLLPGNEGHRLIHSPLSQIEAVNPRKHQQNPCGLYAVNGATIKFAHCPSA